jgi:hypothetical protein
MAETTSPPEIKKTWMPTVAGILSIVAGAIELLGGIAIGGVAAFLTTFLRFPGLGGIFGFPLMALGIVAIIGGIYSLGRRSWGLALAGAICSLFLPHISVLGILAIIFVAISKKEFS